MPLHAAQRFQEIYESLVNATAVNVKSFDVLGLASLLLLPASDAVAVSGHMERRISTRRPEPLTIDRLERVQFETRRGHEHSEPSSG